MLRRKVGELNQLLGMRGADYIARTRIVIAVVVSFALSVCGAHQKNPANHARQLRRVVDNCTGGISSEGEET